MTTWLLKTEPDDYCYADLVRDKRTEWDGVANPTAQMNMRSIKEGDWCFVYHTGKERRIAGLAKVVKAAYPDPAKPGNLKSGLTKFSLIDIEAVREATKNCTLADVKADERFEGFDLVRISRLSVMPVPTKFDKLLRKMAGL